MKRKLVLAAAIISAASFNAMAFDLKDLIGGGDNTITNLIEGVFSKSDIEVSDLAGEWTASGSAVNFKSDNFLKKAGGVAAAAAVESKLNPYFKQYGLTGAVFTIHPDGTFTLKVKKLSLNGTITKSGEGVFDFTFKAFGKMSIGTLPAYVQKTSSSMDIMFDADKLRKLISVIASFSGNSLAKTASSLLDSYDGLCVGFKLDKTGNVEGESSSSTSKSGVAGALQGVFGGKESNGKSSGTQTKQKSSSESGSGATEILQNLFKKKSK